ncbi:MAG: hypothetical protein DI629_19640 [Mesorhizobium amorphae]|nr:MAG: hypothetical protein DI629_19640 [Mesorhizobium amorphae]
MALSALAGSASAADLDMGETEPGRDTSAWALQITPYMWAAGLDGRVSPFRRGPTLEVDKSFSDVLEDLNLGGFVNVWGRAENFVFAADVMYVDTTGAEGTGPLPAFSIPGIGTIPPGAEVDASIDTTEFMASLQGGYRILDAGGITLDALAGARFWHISNDVTVTVSVPFLGSRRASYGESFGWVDPIVGLRGFVPVTERLSIQAQADIGGFGAGSDRTWSAMATANYVFTEKLSASVGYKVLDVDYDDDGHVFDTQLSGPVLGMTYRF